MRFYHKMGIGQKKKELHDEINDLIVFKQKCKLLDLVRPDPTTGALLTKEVVDGVHQLLLYEYLFEHGIFEKK